MERIRPAIHLRLPLRLLAETPARPVADPAKRPEPRVAVTLLQTLQSRHMATYRSAQPVDPAAAADALARGETLMLGVGDGVGVPIGADDLRDLDFMYGTGTGPARDPDLAAAARHLEEQRVAFDCDLPAGRYRVPGGGLGDDRECSKEVGAYGAYRILTGTLPDVPSIRINYRKYDREGVIARDFFDHDGSGRGLADPDLANAIKVLSAKYHVHRDAFQEPREMYEELVAQPPEKRTLLAGIESRDFVPVGRPELQHFGAVCRTLDDLQARYNRLSQGSTRRDECLDALQMLYERHALDDDHERAFAALAESKRSYGDRAVDDLKAILDVPGQSATDAAAELARVRQSLPDDPDLARRTFTFVRSDGLASGPASLDAAARRERFILLVGIARDLDRARHAWDALPKNLDAATFDREVERMTRLLRATPDDAANAYRAVSQDPENAEARLALVEATGSLAGASRVEERLGHLPAGIDRGAALRLYSTLSGAYGHDEDACWRDVLFVARYAAGPQDFTAAAERFASYLAAVGKSSDEARRALAARDELLSRPAPNGLDASSRARCYDKLVAAAASSGPARKTEEALEQAGMPGSQVEASVDALLGLTRGLRSLEVSAPFDTATHVVATLASRPDGGARLCDVVPLLCRTLEAAGLDRHASAADWLQEQMVGKDGTLSQIQERAEHFLSLQSHVYQQEAERAVRLWPAMAALSQQNPWDDCVRGLDALSGLSLSDQADLLDHVAASGARTADLPGLMKRLATLCSGQGSREALDLYDRLLSWSAAWGGDTASRMSRWCDAVSQVRTARDLSGCLDLASVPVGREGLEVRETALIDLTTAVASRDAEPWKTAASLYRAASDPLLPGDTLTDAAEQVGILFSAMHDRSQAARAWKMLQAERAAGAFLDRSQKELVRDFVLSWLSSRSVEQALEMLHRESQNHEVSSGADEVVVGGLRIPRKHLVGKLLLSALNGDSQLLAGRQGR